jgi:hypothetical protein
MSLRCALTMMTATTIDIRHSVKLFTAPQIGFARKILINNQRLLAEAFRIASWTQSSSIFRQGGRGLNDTAI